MSTHAGEPTVSEVMLRRPKTLPASTTVTDARKSLESESVQILLLVDDTRFHGAVTAIPRDAGPDEPVSRYVDESAPIVTEDTPVSQAVGLLPEKAHGRIVVVDGEDLAGLVCLTADGERFCGLPGAMG